MGNTKSRRSSHNGGAKFQSSGYAHSKRNKDWCAGEHSWRDNSAYGWKKIIEQLEKEDVNPKQLKPLSPAEQKEFLDKLNLNVPEDEQKFYEQLILKNHNVFSRSKDDLGKANSFKHKIVTKMDKPIFQKQYPILDIN